MQTSAADYARFAIVGSEGTDDFESIGPFNDVEHAQTYIDGDGELDAHNCRIMGMHAPDDGRFTVVARRPDHLIIDDEFSDYPICHVHGANRDEAARQAREWLADADGDEDPDDYAILAVFIGHIDPVIE